MLIARVLKVTGGNQADAARLLDVERHRLRRKIVLTAWNIWPASARDSGAGTKTVVRRVAAVYWGIDGVAVVLRSRD